MPNQLKSAKQETPLETGAAFNANALIHKLLKEPMAEESDVDSVETTINRWNIIRRKPFLKNIYQEWYQMIAKDLPPGREPVLEIGSGAGFLRDYVPGLITSDILGLPSVDHVLDACHFWPFSDASLRGVSMINVLHHLPDPAGFFAQTSRCLKEGGVLTMIEPWVTSWSSFVYRRLHSEPFIPEASSWEFASSGPLSGANGALPWIIFERDSERFVADFPALRVCKIELLMPFRYLASGGVSMRALAPAYTYGLWSAFETMLGPLMPQLAMFAKITVQKS